ncbi:MAG: hypothetical protein AB8I40_05100 [Anaerolineales bacterium]
MKKSILLAAFLIILPLTACTPSPSQITPAADREVSSGAEPTAPPPAAATDTAAPIPTDTPAPEPSPTPDPRVINTQPREIILSVEELAAVGEYAVYGSVPNYKEYQSISNPYANLACIKGYEGAVDFLDETGLVTGWTTQYNLPADTPPLPRFAEFTVMVFQTVDGPEIFMESWDSPCEFVFYDYLGELNFGDQSTICSYEMRLPNGDLSHTRYRLAVRYQNIYLGMKVEENPEIPLDLNEFFTLAAMQMEKIAGLPLVEEVTLPVDFTPGVGCVTPPTQAAAGKKDNSGASVTFGWCFFNSVTLSCRSDSACYLQRPKFYPGSDEPIYDRDLGPCIYTGDKITIED